MLQPRHRDHKCCICGKWGHKGPERHPNDPAVLAKGKGKGKGKKGKDKGKDAGAQPGQL